LNKTEQAQKAVIGWVEDASHAWLAVTLDDEHGFPGAEAFATKYSLIDYSGDNFAGIVYLEEDQDAPAFIKHYNLDGRAWQTFTLPDDNEIRDLPRGEAKTKAESFIEEHFKVITVA
jgi:hypothetical protein